MKWSVYNAQTKQVEFDGNFEADNLKDALDWLATCHNTEDSGCFQLATLKFDCDGYGWLVYEYALTRTGRNSWHVHDCQWGKNFVVEL